MYEACMKHAMKELSSQDTFLLLRTLFPLVFFIVFIIIFHYRETSNESFNSRMSHFVSGIVRCLPIVFCLIIRHSPGCLKFFVEETCNLRDMLTSEIIFVSRMTRKTRKSDFHSHHHIHCFFFSFVFEKRERS